MSLAGQPRVRPAAGGLFRAVLFVDLGRAYQEGEGPLLGDLHGSVGLELRVALPTWEIPLRLIGAWNPWRDVVHPRGRFTVAVAPVF